MRRSFLNTTVIRCNQGHVTVLYKAPLGQLAACADAWHVHATEQRQVGSQVLNLFNEQPPFHPKPGYGQSNCSFAPSLQGAISADHARCRLLESPSSCVIPA